MQPVYAFDDDLPHGTVPESLLGGKGASLAEMTRALSLPVPPGFVITTDVCRQYRTGGWPAGLDEAIDEHLARLGKRMGRRLGDPVRPLLVSVRSGAPVSMPGMMDTLLNVGMTPAIRERLAETTGNAHFAADTWLRFTRR
jgi:pyruvate,orthophosphate dikinase